MDKEPCSVSTVKFYNDKIQLYLLSKEVMQTDSDVWYKIRWGRTLETWAFELADFLKSISSSYQLFGNNFPNKLMFFKYTINLSIENIWNIWPIIFFQLY